MNGLNATEADGGVSFKAGETLFEFQVVDSEEGFSFDSGGAGDDRPELVLSFPDG